MSDDLFKDKRILLTGGTGSFGRKFCEVVLRDYDPHSISVFSRGELLQQEMRETFPLEKRLRFFIGDVRDRHRVYRAMNNIDIVVHAAALKQVPACEYNPSEAVKTNIEGAINVIDAAIDKNVDKVIAISSDKAVYPANLYGATKMVAEKLFVQANTGAAQTKLSCVRYGNVVGSRGSVIPLFKKQKNNGEFTITDKRMTRFWITLDQGVKFVIDSLYRMQGGEIFVPKIPSMRIMDIATAISSTANIKVTGIRPGEKLHEVLITPDESRHTKEFDTYYLIEPEHLFWRAKVNFSDGKPLPDGYCYTSHKNTMWITTLDDEYT